MFNEKLPDLSKSCHLSPLQSYLLLTSADLTCRAKTKNPLHFPVEIFGSHDVQIGHNEE